MNESLGWMVNLIKTKQIVFGIIYHEVSTIRYNSIDRRYMFHVSQKVINIA